MKGLLAVVLLWTSAVPAATAPEPARLALSSTGLVLALSYIVDRNKERP